MKNVVFLLLVAGHIVVGRGVADERAKEIADLIDRRCGERLAAANARPAPSVDDAAFLRRVSLDLLGRIPTVAEARSFLEDRDPNKHQKLVARLTASPLFARHWATNWRRRWIPEADTPQFEFLADDFDDWLVAELRARTPHDRLVASLLTGTNDDERNPTQGGGLRSFLIAGEDKPENLAAHATRAFLGINLDCAQCHDHPFARWSRDQFWQTAAFFARPDDDIDAPTRFILTIPETERRVVAAVFSEPAVAWPESFDRDTGRRTLAGWIVSPRNPFFARQTVNTIWMTLFGRGLVEPLDDLSTAEPTGDPELLDALAEELIRSNFDTATIIAACASTQVYRRGHEGAVVETADRSTAEPIDPQLFAQAMVRGLTGEQLYDSLRTAAGLPVLRDDLDRRAASVERRQWGRRYLTDPAVAAERSILQALQLMNGRLTTEAADPQHGPLIVAVAEGPFLDVAERVDTVFLATVGRRPSKAERAAAVRHFNAAGETDRRRAMADLFWALINTAEFNTNH